MNFPIKKLQKEPLLNSVINVAFKDKRKVYLVGGYLRDSILNREKEICDFDFALKKGAINFLKKGMNAFFKFTLWVCVPIS